MQATNPAASKRPFPGALPEFQATFPDDAACRRYLIKSRWPDGFNCPRCGADKAWARPARALFICQRCRTETSITAGTILHRTHLPLTTWFGAAYLVATTPRLSALSLGRQLGLTSRKTTTTMMARLRRAMSSQQLPSLPATIEANETVIGGNSDFKRWLLGTYHKPPIDDRLYLDEFRFRAEFHGDPATAFETLLRLAITDRERNPNTDAADRPSLTRPVISIQTREERVAARRAMLAFSARRQRPGSGSMLYELMKEETPVMDWWRKAARLLQGKGIQMAVTGAVAANAYMPPRSTADLDLALPLADLANGGQALTAAGWRFLGDLQLYEDLEGTAWKKGPDEIDLIGLPGAWGQAAISDAQGNRVVAGLPTLTLPYVVVMKLLSARPQDSADIARMLGPAADATLNTVRAAVRRLRPGDVDELEQMIALGKLEYQRN